MFFQTGILMKLLYNVTEKNCYVCVRMWPIPHLVKPSKYKSKTLSKPHLQCTVYEPIVPDNKIYE